MSGLIIGLIGAFLLALIISSGIIYLLKRKEKKNKLKKY